MTDGPRVVETNGHVTDGLAFELVDVDRLKPHPRNPRRGDVDAVEASIKANGFFGTLVAQRSSGHILAGNHRYLAARRLGFTQVPVVWVDVDDERAERILLADNRTADLAGYDDETLRDLLEGLAATDAGLDGTAWRDAELARMLADVAGQGDRPGDPDDLPPVPKKAKTRPGDLWHLGAHRLLCGDSRRAADLDRLMAGERADLLITSPPYNVDVPYESHDDRFAPWVEYSAFLRGVLEVVLPHVAEGGAVAWNIGTSPRTFPARQQVLLEDQGLAYVRTIVWEKVGVPVPLAHNMARDGRTRYFTPNYVHELVLIYANGEGVADEMLEADPTRAAAVFTRRQFDPVEMADLVVVFAKGARLAPGGPAGAVGLEGDVIRLSQAMATRDIPTDASKPLTGARSNLDRRSRKAHPAAFPVELPLRFIPYLADVGAVVLDPFMGAGSTILAAARTGRRAFGIELEPAYCDVACERYQRATGDAPVLERTGKAVSFA